MTRLTKSSGSRWGRRLRSKTVLASRTRCPREGNVAAAARDRESESWFRAGAELTIRTLRIDPWPARAYLAGLELDLTRTEFDLLSTLCQRPTQAFSRRQLIDAVWGDDWFGDEHLVDVHIGHLRRKLADDAAEPEWIRTVRGVGYGMVT